MVDYGWALLGVLAVLVGLQFPIDAFLLFAARRRGFAASRLRTRSLVDLAEGALGLVYVVLVVTNGGLVFLIGSIGGLGLILVGVLGLRTDTTKASAS